ncbi:MAG: glycosyltransferase [Chitinophagaceae bacterium]|nr:glycosyltransferase [Chitinophagaceae bacterium]MCW5904735.1 glycosyltransferase [Chitinophagaceae bacterium]
MKHLHIICFTVPYPPDYGGVIDLFWKLPALQKAGVQIHLHCFEYGRGEQKELNQYCASVHYYKRNTGLTGISISLPYIVASRKNETLLNNLLKDDYPILMEGVHSSYLLNDDRFIHRKKIVRLHNVEHKYYYHLFQTTTLLAKKVYYYAESLLLKKYEQKILGKADELWTVTNKDKDFFINQYNHQQTTFLPLFLPNDWQFSAVEGKGDYVLYQADLSVDTNEKVAIWIVENVFRQFNISLIIAGKNPSTYLQKCISGSNNVQLIANPSEEKMKQLIKDAHINLLPSFSNTGIKLKLLNALYNGKFCVVNNNTIEGTGLDNLCYIANDAVTMQQTITKLFQQPFESSEVVKRKQILETMFNNNHNAMQVVEWAF